MLHGGPTGSTGFPLAIRFSYSPTSDTEAMLQSKAHVRLIGERLPPQQIVVEGRITAACPETQFQSLIGTRLEPQQCMVKGQWFSGSSAHPLLSRISRLPTTPGQGQCYKLSDFRARSTRANHRV